MGVKNFFSKLLEKVVNWTTYREPPKECFSDTLRREIGPTKNYVDSQHPGCRCAVTILKTRYPSKKGLRRLQKRLKALGKRKPPKKLVDAINGVSTKRKSK